ncbi:hypothetical protein JHK87_018761 [Glycine soja]|nr:hypothetical protein JHK87_018761 [Glycine soja]
MEALMFYHAHLVLEVTPKMLVVSGNLSILLTTQHLLTDSVKGNPPRVCALSGAFAGGYVGSSEDNVGFPAVWEVLWVRATTMWVSRERFPEDFRREEKEKSDFRQEDDKEKREGKHVPRHRIEYRIRNSTSLVEISKYFISVEVCTLGETYADIVNDDLCKENLQLAGDLLNSFYCHAAIRWLAAS